MTAEIEKIPRVRNRVREDLWKCLDCYKPLVVDKDASNEDLIYAECHDCGSGVGLEADKMEVVSEIRAVIER